MMESPEKGRPRWTTKDNLKVPRDTFPCREQCAVGGEDGIRARESLSSAQQHRAHTEPGKGNIGGTSNRSDICHVADLAVTIEMLLSRNTRRVNDDE